MSSPRQVWILANALGLALGLEVGWLVDLMAFGSIGIFPPRILGWAIAGLSVGIMQYLALKRLGHQINGMWILGGAAALPIGVIIGFPVAFLVSLCALPFMGESSSSITDFITTANIGCVGGATIAGIGGGIVGVTQSFLVRRNFVRKWIFSNIFGWAIGGCIFGIVAMWLTMGRAVTSGNETAIWFVILPPLGAIVGAMGGGVTSAALESEILQANSPMLALPRNNSS